MVSANVKCDHEAMGTSPPPSRDAGAEKRRIFEGIPPGHSAVLSLADGRGATHLFSQQFQSV